MNLNEVKTFLHATKIETYSVIKKKGLINPYLTINEDIAQYYLEDIEDNNNTGIILAVYVPNINNLIPDYNGIEEPLTFTLHQSEESIWEDWENSNQTWQDSLRIVKSVQYKGIIEPKYISQCI